MAPVRKSRSVNKRFTHSNEASPSKDEGTVNKSRQRKKKLTDMLGSPWSKEELQRFYQAYRRFGKDWKKVAAAVRDRTVEMVESLYTMNRAYLSLPEGTASVVGLIAMMTDHYSIMVGSDSEQESNDGVEEVQKSQKRSKAKTRSTTTGDTDVTGGISQFQTAASTYGCLSFLKKKQSGGGQIRAVGKRTPRFPVKYAYDKDNKEKDISPSRHGQKVKVSAEDDDVAHEVALALAKASHRAGSPQVSCTPNKRKEGSESDMTSRKNFGNEREEDGCEASLGSTEADTGDYPGSSYISYKRNVDAVRSPHKVKKLSGKKQDGAGIRFSHFNDVKEASSGTEGKRISGVKRKLGAEVAGPTGPCSFGSKKKSKKVLFRRADEELAFEALQTLADLSLMMPEQEDAPRKGEKHEEYEDTYNPRLKETSPGPASQQSEKPRALSKKKGEQLSATIHLSKSDRDSAADVNCVPEVDMKKRKLKSPASRVSRTEAEADAKATEIQKKESSDQRKKHTSKSRCSSHTASQPQLGPLGRISENSSTSTDLRKEGDDSVVSSVPRSASDQISLPTKSKNRRKHDKAKIQRNLKDLNSSNTLISAHPEAPKPSHLEKELNLKERLYNSLSNQLMRRWCISEWFYSAIDYPWFSKSEFVEYLSHVGLGHVPRLTRVEWGVIRSSLGKPRRFSDQFLKEEKEKLYCYRESVRSHYTQLRSGIRDGLPTDLARPLTVGQRVIAIHPLTNEIHNGSVLTVDHDRCRIQFDLPELGVEFVMDSDCMPLIPSQSLPALLNRQSFGVDKFFESIKQHEINAPGEDREEEYVKSAPNRKRERINCLSQVATSYPVKNILKQGKIGLTSPTSEIKVIDNEVVSPRQELVSQPSTLAQLQAKEGDIRALAELTRALDRKNALVTEVKHMNDVVSEGYTLRDIGSFKKQYAAVLVQLDAVFDQVASALLTLRQRNSYPGCFQLAPQKAKDRGIFPHESFKCDDQESAFHVSEIVESSRNRAWKMVDAAMQAMPYLNGGVSTLEQIEVAIDYVRHSLAVDDLATKSAPTNRSNVSSTLQNQLSSSGSILMADQSPNVKLNAHPDNGASHIPAELITNCVATLFMIQKCTERQFPPSDVAQILDLAVTGLQPRYLQNLPLYAEIQKCMGIARNQILALVPT